MREIKSLRKTLQCNQCDFMCAANQYMNEHKEFRHEGIQYSCDKCKYASARKSLLAAHVKAMQDLSVISVATKLYESMALSITLKLSMGE